jgi:hypothetical protein
MGHLPLDQPIQTLLLAPDQHTVAAALDEAEAEESLQAEAGRRSMPMSGNDTMTRVTARGDRAVVHHHLYGVKGMLGMRDEMSATLTDGTVTTADLSQGHTIRI